MRDFLLLLLLGAVCYLGYDNYSKRKALADAQRKAEQASATPAPTDQIPQKPPQFNPRAITVLNPTPPSWFQERLREGSSLDSSRQHKQEDERDGTDRSRYDHERSSPSRP
jgi:hypothetical protein